MESLEDRTLLSGGGLDPSFGNGGIVTTDIKSGTEQINDIALQQNGQIVAVGTTSSNNNDFAVVRYNANGITDSAFGAGGIVTTDFGGDDHANGVAIQTNGKILVAGSTSIGSNFALARYNTNGTLDGTFGQGGLLTTDVGGVDAANSIVIQPDGKIILAGSSDSRFALVRYTPGGLLDTTFGNGGKVITDVSGASLPNIARDVILQPDLSIVVGGEMNGKFAVVRYNQLGQLDNSFGTAGKVITDFPNRVNAIHDMALQTNGSIVAVGESFDPTKGNDFALARYTAAGKLDTSFGTNGTVVSDFNIVDIAYGVAIQTNGKILVAGSSTPGDFRIARYTFDGVLDKGFGTNGSVTTSLGKAFAILLQPDAKFVAAGTTGSDFALARYFVGNPLGDLQFSASMYTTSELSGVATIEVDRVNGSQGSVSVSYATSDGSAIGGVQYVRTSGTLDFAPGVTRRFFTIPILQDGMIDGTTTVLLNLSLPQGGATLGDQPSAVLNITDAPGSLQFSDAVYTVAGGVTTSLITVTRAIGDGGAVSVDFATSDGSARAGVDYVPAAGTLAFADGQLTSSFVITLLNNPIAQGTLTVNLDLSNPTNGATLGVPSKAELDIQEAPGNFQFSAPIFSAAEESGQATITVSRLDGSDGAVSVDYDTSDDTAKAGVNYLPASGTLNFGPGETSKSFNVPILSDGMINGNLGVRLALSNPQGGATLGSRRFAELVIIDSPGKLQFSAPQFGVQESAGVAYVSVTRSVGVGGLVSVDYATSDGTGLVDIDYRATSGTLVFGPGEVAKLIPIPILDDGVIGGGNKTVNLTLSKAGGGATLGAQTTATLNILDAHQPGPEADFDGDGKANLAVFRPPTGQWFIAGVGLVPLGKAGDLPVPGYYDGQDTFDATGQVVPGVHKAETALFRPSTADWLINGPNGVRKIQFGAANLDVPVPADYDGDGQTDLAVYRPTTGEWFILGSTTGPQVRSLGTPNLDTPVPGDYDADGRADLAVYRSSSGQWLIQGSTVGFFVRQFGVPNLDKPIPADYDGDHQTDLALFRGATAQWIILRSSGGSQVFQFGAANLDRPMPADYDGDGKADLAVFRPTTDDWYILQSSAGGRLQQFGQVGVDLPVQPPIAFRATSASSFSASSSLRLAGSFAPSGGASFQALSANNPASSVDEQTARFQLASTTAPSTPSASETTVHDHALAVHASFLEHPLHRLRNSRGHHSHRPHKPSGHV